MLLAVSEYRRLSITLVLSFSAYRVMCVHYCTCTTWNSVMLVLY